MQKCCMNDVDCTNLKAIYYIISERFLLTTSQDTYLFFSDISLALLRSPVMSNGSISDSSWCLSSL